MTNVYHNVPNNLSFDFISQYRRKQKIYEELLKSKSETVYIHLREKLSMDLCLLSVFSVALHYINVCLKEGREAANLFLAFLTVFDGKHKILCESPGLVFILLSGKTCQ